MKKLSLRLELLQEIGIPERYLYSDITEYVGKPEALQQVNKYVKEFQHAYDNGIGLVLFGDSNSQKTALICHLLKSVATRGFHCQYLTVREIVDVEMNKQLGKTTSVKQLVRIPQLLCLDGLDVSDNSLEQKFFRQAIKQRIDDSRPTIIGTRILPENFSTVFGEWFPPVVDGNFLTVECHVEPHRWLKAQHKKKSFLEI